MRLPATQPVNDPAGLWSLQLELLAMAESLLGLRETSKKSTSRSSLAKVLNSEIPRTWTAPTWN